MSNHQQNNQRVILRDDGKESYQQDHIGYGMLCEGHRHDIPVTEPSEENGYAPIGCPECGHMIATTQCPYCKLWFIDWGHDTFDDVIAGPNVTSSGDFCCTYCNGFESESYDDDFYEDYGDDYP
jgi:hypothetical protein